MTTNPKHPAKRAISATFATAGESSSDRIARAEERMRQRHAAEVRASGPSIEEELSERLRAEEAKS